MKKTQKEAMKRVEEELLLLLNRRLFEKGLISKTLFDRAQTLIVSGQKQRKMNA